MKKLMIAAAAAAMICGAEAADYTFKATLHTTVGEMGEEVFARGSANLGRNADGFWYNDPALLDECTSTGTDRDWTNAAKAKYPNLYWVIGQSSTGKAYPKLAIKTQDLPEYGDEGKNVALLTSTNEVNLLNRLAGKYNQQSYDQWCGQYVWWTKTAGDCYRVYAADDIEAVITIAKNDCCADDKGYFQLTNGTPCVIFKDGLFNRFGAQTADKAFLYEIFAQVTNLTMEASGLAFNGYLAGQGFRDEDNEYPTELHGRIVGYTEAPSCVDKDCCVDDVKTGALAFECSWSTEPDKTLRTAANGEFRIIRK